MKLRTTGVFAGLDLSTVNLTATKNVKKTKIDFKKDAIAMPSAVKNAYIQQGFTAENRVVALDAGDFVARIRLVQSRLSCYYNLRGSEKLEIQYRLP